MHHRLDAVLAQYLGQAIGFGDIADDQPARRIGNRRDISLHEIVIGDRIVPVCQAASARQALPT